MLMCTPYLLLIDCWHFALSKENDERMFSKETEFKFENEIPKISLSIENFMNIPDFQGWKRNFLKIPFFQIFPASKHPECILFVNWYFSRQWKIHCKNNYKNCWQKTINKYIEFKIWFLQQTYVINIWDNGELNRMCWKIETSITYTDWDYRNAIRWNYRRDRIGTATWLKISIYLEVHIECK